MFEHVTEYSTAIQIVLHHYDIHVYCDHSKVVGVVYSVQVTMLARLLTMVAEAQ